MSTPFTADDIIYTAEARKRADYLYGAINGSAVADDGTNEYLEDCKDELRKLLELRIDIEKRWGVGTWHGKNLSLVSEHYWEEYAADHARDTYGDGAATEFWKCKKYARALQSDMQSVTFDGTEYWGDGER